MQVQSSDINHAMQLAQGHIRGSADLFAQSAKPFTLQRSVQEALSP